MPSIVVIEKRLILALWILFLGYWAIASFGVKRNVGTTPWWQLRWLRVALVAVVVLAVQVPIVRHGLRHAARSLAATSPLAGIAGLVLTLLGLGLALFARLHLGRNWGMPMSRKVGAELVMTGPYALIRHPIYAGVWVAILGAVIGDNGLWLVPLALSGAYFGVSARREESIMLELFPAQYREYMQRTWMLLPGIF